MIFNMPSTVDEYIYNGNLTRGNGFTFHIISMPTTKVVGRQG